MYYIIHWVLIVLQWILKLYAEILKSPFQQFVILYYVVNANENTNRLFFVIIKSDFSKWPIITKWITRTTFIFIYIFRTINIKFNKIEVIITTMLPVIQIMFRNIYLSQNNRQFRIRDLFKFIAKFHCFG